MSKRLGTGLRNTVKVCKAKGITLGGRSDGSLTEVKIVKLTKYYKNSVLRNLESVVNMKQDILATLHHCVSTDSTPRHTKCPQGEQSWCFFNRAIAKGETPGPHATNLHTSITPTVLRHIFPVYQRLVAPGLLKRCQQGKTQNANESLHAAIWKKCPKVKNASKRLVEFAASEAIQEYNFGNNAQSAIMKAVNVSPGRSSDIIMKAQDKRRLFQSKKRLSLQCKKYRQAKKIKKLKK